MNSIFKNFFSATKNVAQRSAVGILCIGLVSVFVISSCDKWERLRVDELIEAIANYEEPCYCIMDTLKGEWVWFETYGGIMGRKGDNRYKSVVKILGQNGDGSINYEVWVRDTLFAEPIYSPYDNSHHGVFVNDTLFSSGSFQILVDYGLVRIVDIKLPHWYMYPPPNNEKWNLFFGIPIPIKDTLCFDSYGTTDGYSYCYYKIKK